MGGETGVEKVAFDAGPLVETAVIVHLQIVCDDEGDDVVSQAFAEHYQATNATVAVLKRVDCLESLMEVDDVLDCRCFLLVVFF